MSNIQKQHKISPAIAWLTIQKFIIFYCPLDGEHTISKVCGFFFFFELKTNFFISPHAFERGLSLAERNTPIAQNFVLYFVYFALAGGYYAGKVGAFVNGCLCIHSHYAIEGR